MIKFHLLEKEVPAGEDKGKKLWYAQVRSGDVIPFEKVCEYVASRSSATYGDVAGVLRGVVTVVTETLEMGHIVDLGRFGRMRMCAGSKGVESDEELTAHMMKKGRVIFTPGAVLKDMLGRLKFKRVKLDMVEVVKDCEEDHG